MTVPNSNFMSFFFSPSFVFASDGARGCEEGMRGRAGAGAAHRKAFKLQQEATRLSLGRRAEPSSVWVDVLCREERGKERRQAMRVLRERQNNINMMSGVDFKAQLELTAAPTPAPPHQPPPRDRRRGVRCHHRHSLRGDDAIEQGVTPSVVPPAAAPVPPTTPRPGARPRLR